MRPTLELPDQALNGFAFGPTAPAAPQLSGDRQGRVAVIRPEQTDLLEHGHKPD
jgi:hypothetical protein